MALDTLTMRNGDGTVPIQETLIAIVEKLDAIANKFDGPNT